METRKTNSDIYAVFPEEILSISEEIRIKSASQSRVRLLLKDSITRRSADNHQTQETFDHTSKSDLPRNEIFKNIPAEHFNENQKQRINSAYSAYSASKENTTCWRNIIKTDSLVSYRNPSDRITASEMCQSLGYDCKLCSAKLRSLSKSDDSKIELHNFDKSLAENKNPFQRIINKSQTQIFQDQITNHKLSQNQFSDLFFLNLQDLRSKLSKISKPKNKYLDSKDRLKSAILYDENLKRFEKSKRFTMEYLPKNKNHLNPPLIPLIQQQKFNNFFIT